MGQLTDISNAAANGIAASTPTPADYIEEARRLLESLQYGCGHRSEAERDVLKIRDCLTTANVLADVRKPSTGYDLWVLDRIHDTDPFKGRSIAEMQDFLEKTVERFVAEWEHWAAGKSYDRPRSGNQYKGPLY